MTETIVDRFRDWLAERLRTEQSDDGIEYRRRDDVMKNNPSEYEYPDKLRAKNGTNAYRTGADIYENHIAERNTDYDFPQWWGQIPNEDEQDVKNWWYQRERVFRQAMSQDTTVAQRYRAVQNGDVSPKTDAMPLGEAIAMAEDNEDRFRYGSDDD